MSEVQRIKAENAKGDLIKEFDLELPTEFEELEIVPGKEKSLKMVRNQMKIEARAVYKRPEGKPREPGLKAVKAAAKEAGITYDELLAFIKERRAA